MPDDFVSRYQAKFDREFPHGALAAWRDKSTATYLVPRIMVTGQRGLDPEIWLPVFAGSNKTLGPFRVLSVQETQHSPYAIQVLLDNVQEPLLLSAGVSPEAAAAMAADRASFTALAPAGGQRVFDGDAQE
jgi:hypothetical protein